MVVAARRRHDGRRAAAFGRGAECVQSAKSGNNRNDSEAPRVAKTTRSCGRLSTLESSPIPIAKASILEYRFTLFAVISRRGLENGPKRARAASDHKPEGQLSDGERPSIVGPQTTG